MEDTPEIQDDLGEGGQFKNWLQDNIRIILAVLIVVAIAAGIYSYSKRGELPLEEKVAQLNEESEVTNSVEGDKNAEAVTIIGEEEAATKENKENAEQPTNDETNKAVTEKKAEPATSKEKETTVTSSQETEDAFVEVAMAGDSVTTLARRATRNYLEKNTDQGLTKEHKIYIEDYLQKQLHQGKLKVGDNVSFSKTLIKQAVESAKTLQPNQLKNLKKYSARVSNL